MEESGNSIKKLLWVTIILIFLAGCSAPRNWVGDIAPDSAKDNPAFKACNEDHIYQYHNFDGGSNYYKEGKLALTNFFIDSFDNSDVPNQNGWIRIRFVVNCEGKSGRFRIASSDFNYAEMTFDDKITGQLLELTKSIDTWTVFEKREQARDYYLYLIFKIENGKLTEVMP